MEMDELLRTTLALKALVLERQHEGALSPAQAFKHAWPSFPFTESGDPHHGNCQYASLSLSHPVPTPRALG
jgi:hypothetical protein